MFNLRNSCIAVFGALGLTALPSMAVAAEANLQPNDFVGISFWLISMALVAATVFLLH